MAAQLQVRGRLYLDVGAVHVLTSAGRSLLPVGVTGVSGHFSRGELVACIGPDQREVARGLVNYSAVETSKIIGKPSAQIEGILGYVDEPELIHRDNLVIV
jgi:glutamate 5-kinase